MARITKTTAAKIKANREAQAEYENNHSLEATVVMAFDTARNTMASVNNVAMICRNKTEIKLLDSIGELEEAYANLLS
jgi:hypothetical protein